MNLLRAYIALLLIVPSDPTEPLMEWDPENGYTYSLSCLHYLPPPAVVAAELEKGRAYLTYLEGYMEWWQDKIHRMVDDDPDNAEAEYNKYEWFERNWINEEVRERVKTWELLAAAQDPFSPEEERKKALWLFKVRTNYNNPTEWFIPLCWYFPAWEVVKAELEAQRGSSGP